MATRNLRLQAMSQHARSQQSVGSQRGYLTVSLTLLVFVVAALLTLYVERQSEHARLERGEQIGHALDVLGAGFNIYLDTNYVKLAQTNPSVPGVAHALQPTAEELIRLLNIRGVAPVPPVIVGGSYRFQVSYPATCTPARKLSDTACRPVGLAYIDKPAMRGAKVDYVMLGRAVRVMHGRGGHSRTEDASHFSFPDGSASRALVPVVNPTGQAGILAWRADTLPEDRERLMTNGGNRMNATLRLDGAGGPHDVAGAANITASGNILLGGSGTIQGRLSVGGNTSVLGNMKVDENMTVWGNATILGVPKVKELNFSDYRVIGGSCENKSSIGISEFGEILFCNQSNRWTNTQRGPQVEYIEFNAPTGFLQELVKHYFDMGKWIYCRDVVGSSILWTEDNLWKSSVFGNSGFHKVACYGRM